MRRQRLFALVAVVLSPSWVAAGEGPYKVESLKEGAPTGLSAAVKGGLGDQGDRILDAQGKPYADLWVRKAIPASTKPAGPKGAVLFPELAEGELLGALRFAGEGGDYRGQPIASGVYTLRYGLQPVNGAHLGVSTYRDYALLVPAAKDESVEDLPQKKLEQQSAEAAESSHPAILMFLPAPEGASKAPDLVHDAEKDLWGLVLALPLQVKGDSSPAELKAQLIVVGTAME